MKGEAAWAIFNDWEAKPAPVSSSWESLDAFQNAASRFLSEELALVPEILSAWKKRLKGFDGDPATRDWNKFRPLRLDREEDWSDWLAHLLESSRSGHFASSLFNRPGVSCCDADVAREVTVEDRRADLVIKWASGGYCHLEVKIGDTHLAKTFATAAHLRRRYADYPDALRGDFILIPAYMAADWDEECKTQIVDHPGLIIKMITWEQTAEALRSSLLTAAESTLWRSFAYAFCGCIEQKIMRLPLLSSTPTASYSDLVGKQRRIAMMRRILADDGD